MKTYIMKAKPQKSNYDFLNLFDKLLRDLNTGGKLLPNGADYTKGTIQAYQLVRNNLSRFQKAKKFKLRIRDCSKMNERQWQTERNYWKRFYIRFSDYLYNTRGTYDNYVGSQMKIIRAFLNYLKVELFIDTLNLSRLLYVPKENIPVIALTVQQLEFLMHNHAFGKLLPNRLKRAKDIFLIGCFTALRYSDLMTLTKNNLQYSGGRYLLTVCAKKTKRYSTIPLSGYAMQIFKQYEPTEQNLLPKLSLSNFNNYLKEIGELAGWTHPIEKWRERRGVFKEIKLKRKHYRFCDLLSSHTMRKTAISTMIELGVPEHIVRSISGHAPNSKDFFRYVAISQAQFDQELDKYQNNLKNYKID
jgi:integrase